MVTTASVARLLLAVIWIPLATVAAPRAAVDDGPQAQTATPRTSDTTARVRGRVFSADTGKPLAGAVVNLVSTRASNPAERQGRWVRTDADGQWEALGLPPGTYTLSVSKGGYLRIEYGQ